MITRAVLDERVREWGLRDDVVEKDYVLGEASGIDFSVQEPRVRLRPGGRTAEGRVYYRGPRGAPAPARIKLDLSAEEVLARPPVLRSIAHAYPDELPAPARFAATRLRSCLPRRSERWVSARVRGTATTSSTSSAAKTFASSGS